MQTNIHSEKETIIFIHGLVGNRRAFKKEQKRFSASYNIITYDLLGHGDDKGEAIDFSLQRLVDQLLNLYEQEGIKKSTYLCAKLRLLHLYNFCANASRKSIKYLSYWRTLQ